MWNKSIWTIVHNGRRKPPITNKPKLGLPHHNAIPASRDNAKGFKHKSHWWPIIIYEKQIQYASRDSFTGILEVFWIFYDYSQHTMRIFVDSFRYKLRRLFKYKFLALLALQYFPFAKIFFLKHTKCVTKSKHLFNKDIFFSLKTLFTQKNYGKKTSIYCGYSTLITFNWNYLQTAICKCRPVLIISTPVNNKMTSYLLQTQLISIQILRQTYLTRESQDRFKIIRFVVNIKSYLYLPKSLLVFHRQCALYIKEDLHLHFNIYVIFSMSVWICNAALFKKSKQLIYDSMNLFPVYLSCIPSYLYSVK